MGSKEAKMKVALRNIGVFANDAERPGADLLARSDLNCPSVDSSVLQNIFAQLGIRPGGCFNVIPTEVLENDERKKLISALDAKGNDELDLKLPCTEDELEHLIGRNPIQRLRSLLPH